MKAAVRLGLAALAVSLAAGAATAATVSPRIVEAGGVSYPERSYVLSLPTPRSLKAGDVKVTENGVRVPVLGLDRQGTVNSRSAVVIALDESLTMAGKPIVNAFAAARAFAAHANPNEEIAVVTFNGKVDVIQGFTTSAAEINAALSRAPKLAYGTKNYDALQKSLDLISSEDVASGSIIMLTDGQNVGSVAKPGSVLRGLAKAHVRVFSVGLYSPAFKPVQLQDLATATGGFFVRANGPSQLGPILVALGRRLSSEYLLTYQSRSNPSTQVVVRVAVNGLGVAASEYTTPPLRVVVPKPYKPSLGDRVVQSIYTMSVVAVLFAVLLGFSVAYVARARMDPLVDRVGDFVSVQREAGEALASKGPLFRRPSFLSKTGTAVDKNSWPRRLAAALELADIDAGPYQAVGFVVIVMIFFLLLAIAASQPVLIVLALAVPFVGRFVVRHRIAKKRRAFAEQLPDNLDVLASSLRAGHSLVSALSVVADDASEPSKSEFRRVLTEEQFGVQIEDAFKVVVDRMENSDLDQVALVARLQREMGSNSAEVLDRVVETVRARMELRRLIQTLTAQGRLTRLVLTLLPIGLALVMTLVSRGYMHPLYHETKGRLLLVMAAGMVALGSFLIGKIIDIRV